MLVSRLGYTQEQARGCAKVAHLPPSCGWETCAAAAAELARRQALNGTVGGGSNFNSTTAALAAAAAGELVTNTRCLTALFREGSYLSLIIFLLPLIGGNFWLVRFQEAKWRVWQPFESGAPAGDATERQAQPARLARRCLRLLPPKMGVWAIERACYDLDTQRGLWMGFSYAIMTALLSSFNILASKMVGELLLTTIEGDDQFRSPVAYIFIGSLVVCNTCSIVLLSLSLSKFDALFIVPCYQVSFTILCIVSGGTFFDEFHFFSFIQWPFFMFGMLSATCRSTHRRTPHPRRSRRPSAPHATQPPSPPLPSRPFPTRRACRRCGIFKPRRRNRHGRNRYQAGGAGIGRPPHGGGAGIGQGAARRTAAPCAFAQGRRLRAAATSGAGGGAGCKCW